MQKMRPRSALLARLWCHLIPQTPPTARKISRVSAVPQFARLGGGWCSSELSGLGQKVFFQFIQYPPPFFAARVVRQCSEYSEKPRCPHRSIYFLYSDLTDAVTCWPTHTSSTGGRSSLNSNRLQSAFLYGNFNFLDA